MHARGELDAAAEAYERVIAADPAHADAHYFLGNIFGQRGDHEAAVRCFGAALQARPAFAAAARNLGATLQLLGRTTEAIACYRAFLAQAPGSADIYLNLANALADSGAREDAIAAYREALRLEPARGELHVYIGHLLDELGRLDAATTEYERAVAANPSIAAVRALGSALAGQGRAEQAIACYRRAAADAGSRVRAALVLPPVASSKEKIAHWRDRLSTELDRLGDVRLRDPLTEVATTHFFASYHGLPNRALNSKLASFYARACPELLADYRRERRKPGKLRIGFISHFLRGHSIGKTTRGLVTQLLRDEFEVLSIFVPPLHDDEVARAIRAASDRSVVLPMQLDAARRELAGLDLDVLFYQDIGMEPFTYFLAFARLAPVQCLSFGHPDTTGIPAMDWFISNDLYEPEGAPEHYSERLFLLRDLGTLAYYYRPPAPPRKRREDFGLPSQGALYLCPQTLFKLHPDMDALIAGILRADGGGRVVLIEGESSHWRAQLRARLTKAAPDIAERVLFLPRQKGSDFTALVACADVMLDTVHFNGMNTSLEAFAVGTPVVTLPGELQRARHTPGMYRKMGWLDCVAADAEDYVRIAVALGTEADRREQARRAIGERSAVLFEDARAVREFERFFREAC